MSGSKEMHRQKNDLHKAAERYAEKTKPANVLMDDYKNKQYYKNVVRNYKRGANAGYAIGYQQGVKNVHNQLLRMGHLDAAEAVEYNFSISLMTGLVGYDTGEQK